MDGGYRVSLRDQIVAGDGGIKKRQDLDFQNRLDVEQTIR